ncbi:hypothetical protein [Streptomyces bobili]
MKLSWIGWPPASPPPGMVVATPSPPHPIRAGVDVQEVPLFGDASSTSS